MLKEKYTVEEMKNLIKDDNKELKRFKSYIATEYKSVYETANFETNEEEMLNWYFKNFPTIYHSQFYVKCNKKIGKIKVKNEYFVPVSIYEDTESNIDMVLLIMDKYRKYFKTLEEAENCLNNSFKDNIFKLPKKSVNMISKEDIITKYFKTESDFYGNYIINGKECCQAAFRFNYTNLDICSIILSGNDDTSYTEDFETYKEGKKVWDRLCKQKYVNREDLPNSYYSN